MTDSTLKHMENTFLKVGAVELCSIGKQAVERHPPGGLAWLRLTDRFPGAAQKLQTPRVTGCAEVCLIITGDKQTEAPKATAEPDGQQTEGHLACGTPCP